MNDSFIRPYLTRGIQRGQLGTEVEHYVLGIAQGAGISKDAAINSLVEQFLGAVGLGDANPTA